MKAVNLSEVDEATVLIIKSGQGQDRWDGTSEDLKRVSVTQEWGLDVKVVAPLSFLSKISVPCVHVDPGGTFQVYIEMEGMESLAFPDLLYSSMPTEWW
ncbi:hypothetical protein Tco_0331528 [Tanacetum coccineum]